MFDAKVFSEAFQLLFGADGELRQIIWVTIQMSFSSTLLSVCIGMPLGTLLGALSFRGKRLVLRTINTLMGLPPVVAGLIVFMFLSRSGPLGSLRLLFSIPAMVIAQVLLITPIITGLTSSIISQKAPTILETTRGMGLSLVRSLSLVLWECRAPLISVLLTGFGRAIAEVGAVQLVGGNVQSKTRVMTTAIMLETNKGNFSLAIALGIILLLFSFLVNILAQHLQEERV